MLVKDSMTRHPILISTTTLAPEAQKIMMENGIRHLPVVGKGKQLKGLVTRESLRLDPEAIGSLSVWEITRHLSQLPVKDVMIKAGRVRTIGPEQTAERAARIMIDSTLSGLPVVEDEKIVVGIITEVDLLHAFQAMLALPADGIRLTVRMPDRKGEFKKLTAVLANNEIGVMGIGTYPSPRHEGYYDAVLKMHNITLPEVQEIFSQIENFELIDIRDVV